MIYPLNTKMNQQNRLIYIFNIFKYKFKSTIFMHKLKYFYDLEKKKSGNLKEIKIIVYTKFEISVITITDQKRYP